MKYFSSFILALVLLSAAVTQALADTTYYYFSNGVKRPLTLDQSRTLEFGVGAPKLVGANQIAQKTLNNSTAASPVFIDAQTNTVRGLPGGVIVVFAPGTSEAIARERLQGLKLEIVEILVTPTTWLIASAPGFASLNLANQLAQSGHFVSAEPNWWRARRTK